MPKPLGSTFMQYLLRHSAMPERHIEAFSVATYTAALRLTADAARRVIIAAYRAVSGDCVR